jgi:translation initiation factor IF-2
VPADARSRARSPARERDPDGGSPPAPGQRAVRAGRLRGGLRDLRPGASGTGRWCGPRASPRCAATRSTRWSPPASVGGPDPSGRSGARPARRSRPTREEGRDFQTEYRFPRPRRGVPRRPRPRTVPARRDGAGGAHGGGDGGRLGAQARGGGPARERDPPARGAGVGDGRLRGHGPRGARDRVQPRRGADVRARPGRRPGPGAGRGGRAGGPTGRPIGAVSPATWPPARAPSWAGGSR